ncbi:MAG: hypothetical protein ACLGHG_02095 [Gammaproteobacteria bacterium]
MSELDDPFSAAADPYPSAPHIAVRNAGETPPDCRCAGERLSLSRRQALLGVGALTVLPAVASARAFPVPCVQEKQQITPCRHKYCRHYAGYGDYHGR